MSYLPMASHHHPGYNDDNLDYDVDVDGDDESNSSPSVVAGEVTIAVAGVSTSDSHAPLIQAERKRPRIDDFAIPVILPGAVAKKPAAVDESRKLFQRLWTDDDEVELLKGFLEYTTQRVLNNSSAQQHHYDTTAFYDSIKSKFQLDFNKNQLVEKLRRLKKKFRTLRSKMGSGKEFAFKSAHEQVTFEISSKIWGNGGSYARNSPGRGGPIGFPAQHPLEDGGLDDEDAHSNPNPNSDAIVIYNSPKFNLNSNPNPNGPNGIDMKTRSQKRAPQVPAEVLKAEQQVFQPPGFSPNVPMPSTNVNPMGTTPMVGVAATAPVAAAPVVGVADTAPVAASVPSLIEETVRNCVSPIFKELLNNVANLNRPARGFGFGFGFGGMEMSPIPLGFGGGAMSMEMMKDEKWRKQQMLELEVYSKRLELVQDQVKAQLEELRSMGS
ncbi:putative rubredoxin-like [Capsicum annuum]|uniref:Glabrous enhancer-binding protein-like DBD domain-containing protein n=1 Tax=Capsicum annuum TaxID=4072 RepID=A0A2G2YZ18_CAPAN|nr:probable transcription factor At3g04930 [Capsicum annuum]KAF3673375.1 putative rubredoxin-like [Capsicum annuum]KAF3684569.1 putative rubredoxin-like [Capsicum annuum]PHT74979.1 hypothetical protein T459_22256 [Capsicum annuum]